MNGRVAPPRGDRAERAQLARVQKPPRVTVAVAEPAKWTARFNTSLRKEDYEKLLEDLTSALISGVESVGILGLTDVTLRLFESLTTSNLLSSIEAVYTTEVKPKLPPRLSVPVRPFQELRGAKHDLLVVAADEEKETLLRAAEPFITGAPRVIVAGYGHLRFRERMFEEELARLFVPSLANGYPNSLIHVYQCLQNAARLRLDGVVAEFGIFKGGTTMFMSRVIERLGMNWPVFGFDTFSGFPPRRHMFDMYDHPDCEWRDVTEVRSYLSSRPNVKIIAGDIVETCSVLDNKNLIMSFVDTDNYTSANAALEVARRQTVVGGAIVLDHFTGVDRFRYTLGERMAAQTLVDDPRYFNLHGTGVFYRQR